MVLIFFPAQFQAFSPFAIPKKELSHYEITIVGIHGPFYAENGDT